MGWYAAQHNDKVVRPILHAPQWLRNTPSLVHSEGELGAYRTVSREAATISRSACASTGPPPEQTTSPARRRTAAA
jgi:hypothetical protein